MTDQELINAMQALIKPISRQLEDIYLKMEESQIQVSTLRLELKSTESAIKKEIRHLQDGQDTLIAVLEAKDILPKVE